MIVCPVCEHAQAQGAECEVCGRSLLAEGAAIGPAAPVEGLEPTRHAEVTAGAEAVPDLERTAHPPVDAPEDRVPDVEDGRSAPVDVAPDALPDLERTASGIPGDVATALSAFVTCRYCRTPALPGERICGRCGMRLPLADAAPEEAAPPAPRCSCGLPVTGARCPGCGARLA